MHPAASEREAVREKILDSTHVRLFLDVTRICSRVLRSTPTGIDRIDLDYLEHALARPRDIALDCVLTTPAFVGVLGRPFMAEIASAIRETWVRRNALELDGAFGQTRILLERGGAPEGQGCTRVQVRQAARRLGSVASILSDLAICRGRLHQSVRAARKNPARLYLHTSHTQLEHGRRFQWLQAPQINPVFFIHDTIPVEYPEFCSPGSSQRHEGRLATVSRTAARVIVNSQTTQRAVERYWRDRSMRVPDCAVVPLGVGSCFQSPEPTPRIDAARPYFLCIGTLEPRKNHLLMFSVWRHLVETMGDKAPMLVLVGQRGWQNENIIDVLERSRQLSRHVIEVSGLGDAGLVALLRSSHGLLAPSMAEGFGLPVAEALSMGVPVIASDIEAHREVSDGGAVLVGAHDSLGWAEAIRRQAEDRTWTATRINRTPTSRLPRSSTEHVEAVFDMLLDFGRRAPTLPAPLAPGLSPQPAGL